MLLQHPKRGSETYHAAHHLHLEWAGPEPRLEVWAARERVALLSRLLGREVRVVLQTPKPRRKTA